MKNELEAAAEVAREVADLYSNLQQFAFQHQTTTNKIQVASIESEIASLLEKAESCCQRIAACNKAFGVIYSELGKLRTSDQFPPDNYFFVQWAAEQCRILSGQIRNILQTEADFPGVAIPRPSIEQFREDELLQRTADRCRRAAAIADGLAYQHDGDDEADGPCEPLTWREQGQVIDDKMNALAWRMVKFLWSRRSKTCEWSDLKDPVYGDSQHDTTGDAIPSLAKKANQFFRSHKIGWKVRFSSAKKVGIPTVCLEEVDRP